MKEINISRLQGVESGDWGSRLRNLTPAPAARFLCDSGMWAGRAAVAG